MLELIEDMPGNVLAIKASGEVTAEDYETIMVPAVEARLKQFDKVRMLYELGPEMNGFTAGAMWQDAKVGMSHLLSFEKIAVVTDHAWVANGVRAFAFMIPCPVKIFSTAERDAAKNWISTD
ncbi:MAG: STAS/SEC14 domain-containing protein [Proteobacteria bacterium]|jgi:hypothetical protein|nr:STAS/SEC14 domain-containing protein [Pseudomonadota bacterium]MCG6936017.1 STAS/SEC14 domain-containing protein [Pseudomonadota bacterium]